jgi:hypothetical protein
MTIKDMWRTGGQVWLALMLLTIGSYELAEDFAVRGGLVIMAGLFLIAFIKARLIIRHFMEVKHAPLPLRIAFDVWVVAAPVALLTVAWMGNEGILN